MELGEIGKDVKEEDSCVSFIQNLSSKEEMIPLEDIRKVNIMTLADYKNIACGDSGVGPDDIKLMFYIIRLFEERPDLFPTRKQPFSTVTHLDFHESYLGGESCPILVKEVSGQDKKPRLFENLLVLDLCDNIITDKYESLCELLAQFPKLQHFYIGWNNIGDDGVKKIANTLVASCPMVVDLDFCKVGMTNDGCDYLCKQLATLKHLRRLGLPENRIGDDGVNAIAHFISSSPQFFELDICNIGMTDTSLKLLSNAVAVHPSFYRLNFTENRISDVSKGVIIEMFRGFAERYTSSQSKDEPYSLERPSWITDPHWCKWPFSFAYLEVQMRKCEFSPTVMEQIRQAWNELKLPGKLSDTTLSVLETDDVYGSYGLRLD